MLICSNCLSNSCTGFPVCDSNCQSGSSSWEYYHCTVPLSPQGQSRGAQSCMLHTSVFSAEFEPNPTKHHSLSEWETALVIMSLPVNSLSYFQGFPWFLLICHWPGVQEEWRLEFAFKYAYVGKFFFKVMCLTENILNIISQLKNKTRL